MCKRLLGPEWPGSANYCRIFQNSRLSVETKLDVMLVGDRGYPCLPFLLTPFADARTDEGIALVSYIIIPMLERVTLLNVPLAFENEGLSQASRRVVTSAKYAPCCTTCHSYAGSCCQKETRTKKQTDNLKCQYGIFKVFNLRAA
ncbi:uncharacterized protein LOC108625099 isoform X2 [Ceratina calcarata]|uniref:Uncharacterized protein LOC108625099 isoform X2 n=1 Tax=Ceratina calcarata TaxID=156304 RepID=A0AAJ7IYM6_9HYME|nr:uncharacterized protein LOC108625099 isoform X2 [Ceratina calcarata]